MQQTNPVIGSQGTKRWYQHGLPHRVDGPAVEHANGNNFWYQHGQLHRLNGPAVEYANGDKCWYQYDQLHRLNGPAIECVDGTKGWYINGVEYTEDQFRLVLFVMSQETV